MSIQTRLRELGALLFGTKSTDDTVFESVDVTSGAMHVTDQSVALSPQGQGAGQTIAINTTGTSRSSQLAGSQIAVLADSKCYVVFGNAAVVSAASGGFPIPANTLVYLSLVPGSYLAVYGASGNLDICPVGEAA